MGMAGFEPESAGLEPAVLAELYYIPLLEIVPKVRI